MKNKLAVLLSVTSFEAVEEFLSEWKTSMFPSYVFNLNVLFIGLTQGMMSTGFLMQASVALKYFLFIIIIIALNPFQILFQSKFFYKYLMKSILILKRSNLGITMYIF